MSSAKTKSIAIHYRAPNDLEAMNRRIEIASL